jgi:hypothetical protein
MDIDRALQSALEYHQAGNLRQAEQSYRKILKKIRAMQTPCTFWEYWNINQAGMMPQ